MRITLADIYRGRGDLGKAETLLTGAAAATQKNGELYTLPLRLRVLAEVQEAEGNFAAADRTYDRADAFIDANIGNDSAVLDKTAWIKSVSDLYVAHFSLLANHLNNPAKAYSVVEQVRGRVMTDLLLGGSQAPVKARENERSISRLRLQMMVAKSTSEVEKIRDQISLLEQARWLTPEVSILKSRRYSHVPLRDVQTNLSPNATILEYVLAEPASWCLVIRRDGLHTVRLAGRQQIEKLILRYLKTVKNKQSGQTEAGELYSALLQPITDAAQPGDLMIVRDGLLNLLPFDALSAPSGKFVGEQKVISYLPSAGSFFLLAGEARRPTQNRKVLAVGAVPYEQAAARFKNLIASHGFGDTVLSNLQNSREEATAAAAIATGPDASIVLGPAATESALKRAAAERYRVIHLAVHSVVDANRPDRAALIFLDDPAAGEDGLLQAPEIAQLRLRTDLVVLSACDTAVGPIQGQEGVATIARSFLLAGARNVISTLWAADDNSSVTLLKRFYAHLGAGDSPALSLAEAKREFIAQFGSAAAPWYWAAFTFEGVPNTATIFHDQRRNTHYSAQSGKAVGNHKGD
jgi:CHAT domain-containing protein